MDVQKPLGNGQPRQWINEAEAEDRPAKHVTAPAQIVLSQLELLVSSVREFVQQFEQILVEMREARKAGELLRHENAGLREAMTVLQAATEIPDEREPSPMLPADVDRFLQLLSETPREWYLDTGAQENPRLDIVVTQKGKKSIHTVGPYGAVAYLLFESPLEPGHEQWLSAGFSQPPHSYEISPDEILKATGLV
jgi:hypothetical protein